MAYNLKRTNKKLKTYKPHPTPPFCQSHFSAGTTSEQHMRYLAQPAMWFPSELSLVLTLVPVVTPEPLEELDHLAELTSFLQSFCVDRLFVNLPRSRLHPFPEAKGLICPWRRGGGGGMRYKLNKKNKYMLWPHPNADCKDLLLALEMLYIAMQMVRMSVSYAATSPGLGPQSVS